MTAMSEASNVGEAEYWRSAQQWVDCQDMLDALLQPVLDRVLTEAALQPGERVLDIGCGTGASTLAAAHAVGPDGHVTGADISGLMLELAQRRTDDVRLDNVTYCEGDAQVHGFASDHFDAVISRFGVMFFEDPAAAFHNIARAVKPGGRLVFLCWAALSKNPWFAVPRQSAIDVLGSVPPADPRAPGPMAFEDRAYVAEILHDASWHDVSIEEISLNLTPKGSLADVASFATRLGPASRIIKDLDGTEDDILKIETLVHDRLAEFATESGVQVAAKLNLVHARA